MPLPRGCEPVPGDLGWRRPPVSSRGVALLYSQVRENGREGLLDGEFKHRKIAGGTQFEESILETCLESWGNLRTALVTLSPDCCLTYRPKTRRPHAKLQAVRPLQTRPAGPVCKSSFTDVYPLLLLFLLNARAFTQGLMLSKCGAGEDSENP